MSSHIHLASGGLMDPLNAQPEDIHIEDIAHSLARLCRYNGHTAGFLSVARHSVWVSYRLEDEGYDAEMQLLGLLHDAAEAYLGDMVSPMKQPEIPIGAAYLEAEAKLERVIFGVFNLQWPFPRAINDADMWVFRDKESSSSVIQARERHYGVYQHDENDFMYLYKKLTRDR